MLNLYHPSTVQINDATLTLFHPPPKFGNREVGMGLEAATSAGVGDHQMVLTFSQMSVGRQGHNVGSCEPRSSRSKAILCYNSTPVALASKTVLETPTFEYVGSAIISFS